MERIEHIDEKGRKYAALSDGANQIIILGPPEDLVDSLMLPEPTATNLHNVLYGRKIYNYHDASRAGNGLMGALQEALLIDVQKLLEAFSRLES